MSYVNFIDGLKELLHECRNSVGMWQTVAFRILGYYIDDNRIKTVIANFQAALTESRIYSQVTITTPFVMEGVISFEEFIDLISSWHSGESGVLANLELERPDIQQLEWNQKIIEDELYSPLFVKLSEFQSKYRFHRLLGNGKEQDYRAEEEFQELCRHFQKRRDEIMMEYLQFNMSPVIRPYLSILLPIAVGISTEYITEKRHCIISVSYKSPLTNSDFWVIVSPDRWESSKESHVFQYEGKRQEYGWERSNFIYELHSDSDPDYLNVWVGRVSTPNIFEWSTRLDMEKPRTSVQIREAFLQTWYDYANQQIAKHIKKQELGTKGKSGSVSQQFEIIIANSFSALGFSVFFGGTILKTPGIDLVAFELTDGKVYVVSVTVSNDVDEKLRSLFIAIEDLRFAFEGWQISLLIVSMESERTFLHNDIVNAQKAGVVILGQESLEALTFDPPNLDYFRKILTDRFALLQTLSLGQEFIFFKSGDYLG